MHLSMRYDIYTEYELSYLNGSDFLKFTQLISDISILRHVPDSILTCEP
jgi:hypothetical protein